jgi:hypothetical protein
VLLFAEKFSADGISADFCRLGIAVVTDASFSLELGSKFCVVIANNGCVSGALVVITFTEEVFVNGTDSLANFVKALERQVSTCRAELRECTAE